jgi:hypothetical protein
MKADGQERPAEGIGLSFEDALAQRVHLVLQKRT